MVKWYNSLQTRLTISFVALILIICGMMFLMTYGHTQYVLKDRMQNEMKAVAGVAALQVNGDEMASLNPGDENTAAYLKIRDQLNRIRSTNEDIRYVYIMRKAGDEIQFVVDADYGITGDGAKIGDTYDVVTPGMLQGFVEPTADDTFTTDQWGTVLSGYAPIKDSRGNVVGIVGVDIADRVIQQWNMLMYSAYGIIILTIILAGSIVVYISRTIIKDLKKLNDTAARISMGDMSATLDIDSKDEIGEVADSFNRMVASLKIMIMMMTEYEEEKK